MIGILVFAIILGVGSGFIAWTTYRRSLAVLRMRRSAAAALERKPDQYAVAAAVAALRGEL